MAGSIGLSLTQRLDKETFKPLNGGKLYFFASGTTTPQNAFQDSGLTIPWPNPLTLDSGGNVPQLFFADGEIKFRLTNSDGVTQLAADNVMVVGSSSGGGGGGGVDATTVLQTGDPLWRLRAGTMTGFARCNGRTLGSSVSGATERANADTAPLYDFLWNNLQDFVCPVSSGRGASSAVDFAANKTIGLPDLRGKAPFGADSMGNSPANVIPASALTAGAVDLVGTYGGRSSWVLEPNMLPAVSPLFFGSASTVTVNSDPTIGNVISGNGGASLVGTTAGSTVRVMNASNNAYGQLPSTGSHTPSGTISPLGSGQAYSVFNPFVIGTWYLKL